MSIYGGATRDVTTGSALMQSSIRNVRCEYGHAESLWHYTLDQCDQAKQHLINISTYVQLKSFRDYEVLSDTLHTSSSTSSSSPESLRIYYLSVSPSLYGDAVRAIHRVGRPRTAGAQMRVVFEKPFGKVGYSGLCMVYGIWAV